MEIGPDKVGNDAPLRPDRAERRQERPAEPPGRPREDRVELSGDARARIAEAADEARRSHYSEQELRDRLRAQHIEVDSAHEAGNANRLQEVRDRIDAGFYEREDVKREIAGRLADELMPPDRKGE